MRRLAMLHTVGLLVERFRGTLRESLPDLPCFHMLDESILQDLLRYGPSPGVTGRVVALARLAADAGADFIVFTCSSTSPAIDVARRCIDVPIYKIDDPMAERAVTLGRRIAVVCTTDSTLEPSSALLKGHARHLGREVELLPILVEGAYTALQAGDQETHDSLVTAEATAAAALCDVVVLAQASLAHLAEPLGARLSPPVLSSPPLIIEAIAARADRT